LPDDFDHLRQIGLVDTLRQIQIVTGIGGLTANGILQQPDVDDIEPAVGI
jgi:hypothetical protein